MLVIGNTNDFNREKSHFSCFFVFVIQWIKYPLTIENESLKTYNLRWKLRWFFFYYNGTIYLTLKQRKAEKINGKTHGKTFNSSQFDLLEKYNKKNTHKNSPDDESSTINFGNKSRKLMFVCRVSWQLKAFVMNHKTKGELSLLAFLALLFYLT